MCFQFRQQVSPEPKNQPKTVKTSKRLPKSKGKRKKILQKRQELKRTRDILTRQANEKLLKDVRNSYSRKAYGVDYDNVHVFGYSRRRQKINDRVREEHPELASLIDDD